MKTTLRKFILSAVTAVAAATFGLGTSMLTASDVQAGEVCEKDVCVIGCAGDLCAGDCQDSTANRSCNMTGEASCSGSAC